jgi:hypothetical protein
MCVAQVFTPGVLMITWFERLEGVFQYAEKSARTVAASPLVPQRPGRRVSDAYDGYFPGTLHQRAAFLGQPIALR